MVLFFGVSPGMRGALLFRRSFILAVAGMIVLWGAVIVGINFAVNHAIS